MKNFFLILMFGTVNHFIYAQELVMEGRFTTAISAQADSFVIFGTFEDQFTAFHAATELIINPDPVIFSFSDSLGTTLHELQPIEGLNISPNPARSSTSIYRNESSEDLNIWLYDQLGNTLFTSSWLSGENKIEILLTDYPASLYFLVIKNEEGNKGSLLKIVKQ